MKNELLVSNIKTDFKKSNSNFSNAISMINSLCKSLKTKENKLENCTKHVNRLLRAIICWIRLPQLEEMEVKHVLAILETGTDPTRTPEKPLG